MSTPEKTRTREIRTAVEKIQHEASTQGLSTEVYRDEILPKIGEMVKVVTEPGTGLFSANGVEIFYEIDWTPFNTVVEKHRPLDVRTLKAVRQELVKHLYKSERDEEKYDRVQVKPVSETMKYLMKQIDQMVAEVEG